MAPRTHPPQRTPNAPGELLVLSLEEKSLLDEVEARQTAAAVERQLQREAEERKLAEERAREIAVVNLSGMLGQLGLRRRANKVADRARLKVDQERIRSAEAAARRAAEAEAAKEEVRPSRDSAADSAVDSAADTAVDSEVGRQRRRLPPSSEGERKGGRGEREREREKERERERESRRVDWWVRAGGGTSNPQT